MKYYNKLFNSSHLHTLCVPRSAGRIWTACKEECVAQLHTSRCLTLYQTVFHVVGGVLLCFCVRCRAVVSDCVCFISVNLLIFMCNGGLELGLIVLRVACLPHTYLLIVFPHNKRFILSPTCLVQIQTCTDIFCRSTFSSTWRSSFKGASKTAEQLAADQSEADYMWKGNLWALQAFFSL